MSVRLRIEGMKDLKDALRDLPAELRAGAAPIIEQAAERAETEIRSRYAAAYPVRSGKLARGVDRTTKSAGQFGVKVIVFTSAKQAPWLEDGTKDRRTKRNYGRGRITAAPVKIFVPGVMRARAQMVAQLIAYVERAGLVVRGG